MEKLIKEVRAYKNALATTAFEGNEFAEYHLKEVQKIDSIEGQHKYLNELFDEILRRISK